ncbi:MAG: polysaccharide deacetylase family protein [Pirellulales bacterium]|nr:polysaccharide deacetylase family protein [Pirellulales bacterium]
MIRSIVKHGCRALYRWGFWDALLAVERAVGWRQHAVVLLYHHIRADDETRLPLSQVEEGVSETAFSRQLGAFCRWYRPCEPAELHAALYGDTSLDDDRLLVTFDDGYRDNRTLAAPILRSHGISGLVFIATGFIESSQRFWWVELNESIRALNERSLADACELCNGSSHISAHLHEGQLGSHAGRRQLRIGVASVLGSLPEAKRQAELGALTEAAGPGDEETLPLLTWDEIRDMQGEGFQFGAHTVSHPLLSRLPDDRLESEVRDSAAAIAAQVGADPGAFAYPHGDVDDRVKQSVQAAGFEAAYAANPGVATPGKTDVLRIPRIQLYADDPARLTIMIVALKASKYFPSIMRPLLSRLVGEPFEV